MRWIETGSGGSAVKARNADIDLGLAILSAVTQPGERRSLREIAAYCGCSRNYVWLLEQRALRKLRNAPALAEIGAAVLGRDLQAEARL